MLILVLLQICFPNYFYSQNNSEYWKNTPEDIKIKCLENQNFAVVQFDLPELKIGSNSRVNLITGCKSGSKLPIGVYDFLFEGILQDTIINCGFRVEIVDDEKPVLINCPEKISEYPDKDKCSKEIFFDEPEFIDNCQKNCEEILPGEVLFTGVRCDNPDTLSFIVLREISVGTELFITDKGWIKNQGFRDGEGIIRWSSNKIVPAGTEIIITDEGCNNGIYEGKPLSLSSSGDQLFIYQSLSEKINFIAGIQLNSTKNSTDISWDIDLSSTAASAKPPGIISGFNGLKFSPERDNCFYIGAKKGSRVELRKNLCNPENWSTSNGNDYKKSSEIFVIEDVHLNKGNFKSGDEFESGITFLNFTARDFSGNENNCEFEIEIIDTTKPVFNSESAILVEVNETNCKGKFEIAKLNIYDLCGTFEVKSLDSELDFTSLFLGEYNILFRATDNSGNYSDKKVELKVVDKTPPEFLEVEDIEMYSDSGKGPVIFNYDIPAAYDNCSETEISKISGYNSGFAFPPGENIIVFEAVDNFNNKSRQKLKVLVKENNRPKLQINKIPDLFEDKDFQLIFNCNDIDTDDILEFKFLTDENLEIKKHMKKDNLQVLEIHPKLNFSGITKLKCFLYDNSSAPNNCDSISFPLDIKPVNDLPKFTNFPDTIFFDGEISAELNLKSIVSDVETEFSDLNFEIDVSDGFTFELKDNQQYLFVNAFENFSGSGNLKIVCIDADTGKSEINFALVTNNITNISEGKFKTEKTYLSDPYPNPFNPTLNIEYGISEKAFVDLSIYNFIGEKIITLVNSNLSGGTYKKYFEASNFPSGIYFVRLRINSFTKTKKVLLLK